MYIYELRYKLKPDADAEELERIFGELVIPICRKIPGFVSTTTYEYSKEQGYSEWDYLYIEAWESKEAYEKAEKESVSSPIQQYTKRVS